MGARVRRQIAESKSEKRIKEFVVGQLMQMRQFVSDGALFHEGSREQLMYQLGETMTVQAGIIEWLDKQFGRPGFTPSDQIASIVQVNVAAARAARAAREEREAEAKRKAEEEAAKPALASVPDEPEEALAKFGVSAEDMAKEVDRLAEYVPAAPADIAPAAPADAAPAQPIGDA